MDELVEKPPRSETTLSFFFMRDPLFLGASLLYGINRYALKARIGGVFPFLRNHWNDCFLIPCALPVLLWLFYKAGLRRHKKAPTWGEILEWTVLWSLVFEWILPCFFHWGTADWVDSLCYAGGAVVAGWMWNKSTPHAAFHSPSSQR
jgi:hypothetical protein